MTVYSPTTEEEAAEFVRSTRVGRLRLIGSGTHLTEFSGTSLSSRRLSGISLHCPEDLTITARAGTTLGEVEKRLRERGQCLGFEPYAMDATSTIGAVAAMNLSGPRRPFMGAARDALLGVRLVTGLGEVVATGSRALKNVAGLDLTKVIATSRGSLGFITEVVFKALPIQEAEVTLMAAGISAVEFPALVVQAMLCGAPVTGAAYLGRSVSRHIGICSDPVVLIRLEGNEAAVAAGRSELRAGFSPLARRDAPCPWRLIRDGKALQQAAPGILWRVIVPPARGGELAQSLATIGAESIIDWRGGLLWVRHENTRSVTQVTSLIERTPEAHARLIDGPAEARPKRRASAGLVRLSSQLKGALDPKGLFDTGPLHLGIKT